MNVQFLDLSRQYNLLKHKIEPEILKQISGGQYIGGAAVTNFEKKFAAYVGVKHAIALNSGTDALVICLRALGVKAGDEIITTPFTFFATAEAIAAIGAVPVFVDINKFTYNIDVDKIEEKITNRTKAILPVHIFGQPADMTKIVELAHRYNLKVIEDACQAIGAKWRNKFVGSIGDLASFSFFPTKNLGAFGDGGMITTDNHDLAVICRALREHGMGENGAKAKFILDGIEDDLVSAASQDGLYNPYKYYNYIVGYNSRLDALQATILNIKLDYLEKFNKQRKAIADYYNQKFQNIEDIQLPIVDRAASTVWHQYAFQCAQKDALGDYLSLKGIGSAAFYPVPLHLQKAFLHLNYKTGDLPIAEMVCKQTVCLPIFPELTEKELDLVSAAVIEFFKK